MGLDSYFGPARLGFELGRYSDLSWLRSLCHYNSVIVYLKYFFPPSNCFVYNQGICCSIKRPSSGAEPFSPLLVLTASCKMPSGKTDSNMAKLWWQRHGKGGCDCDCLCNCSQTPKARRCLFFLLHVYIKSLFFSWTPAERQCMWGLFGGQAARDLGGWTLPECAQGLFDWLFDKLSLPSLPRPQPAPHTELLTRSPLLSYHRNCPSPFTPTGRSVCVWVGVCGWEKARERERDTMSSSLTVGYLN